jgi:hypothetical protein
MVGGVGKTVYQDVGIEKYEHDNQTIPLRRQLSRSCSSSREGNAVVSMP